MTTATASLPAAPARAPRMVPLLGDDPGMRDLARRQQPSGAGPDRARLHSPSTGSPVGGRDHLYIPTGGRVRVPSRCHRRFSRKVVGSSMSSNQHTELVTRALRMAITR
jgi:hypothetical protein